MHITPDFCYLWSSPVGNLCILSVLIGPVIKIHILVIEETGEKPLITTYNSVDFWFLYDKPMYGKIIQDT